MALQATPDQLERLISTAQELELHAREWADELIDQDEDQDKKLYTESVEEIESAIDAFNAIRLEIEGSQLTTRSAA